MHKGERVREREEKKERKTDTQRKKKQTERKNERETGREKERETSYLLILRSILEEAPPEYKYLSLMTHLISAFYNTPKVNKDKKGAAFIT